MSEEIQPNQILNGRYRVVRELGRGGMGAVYLAEDLHTHRSDAIKVARLSDPVARDQFQREAGYLRRLSHHGLPRVWDVFSDTQRDFLVMEFIPGDNLDAVVRTSGPRPEWLALRWADELLDALSYLHGQNPPVIHRDIKPSNLKLRADESLVLVDFGIAKELVPGQLTLPGASGVSPGYSPPEQYSGDTSTDACSDLYSVGATLYFLLAGEPPPAAMALAAGLRTLTPLAELAPEVSPATQDLIEHALQLQRDRRWPDAAAMRIAVNHAAEKLAGTARPAADESLAAARPVPSGVAAVWSRRLARGLAGVLAVLALFTLGATQVPAARSLFAGRSAPTAPVVAATATVLPATPTSAPSTPPPARPTEVVAPTAAIVTPGVTTKPTGAPTSTMIPVAASAEIGTPALSMTPATATATDLPSPTDASLDTPNKTPAPPPDAVVAGAAVNIREGPGQIYRLIGSLPAGSLLRIAGKNPDGTWLRIEGAAKPSVRGWMYAGGLTINVDLSKVALAEVPPTPASTEEVTSTSPANAVCAGSRYKAPSLIAPEDGVIFANGALDSPLLQWTSVGLLGPEDYYVVTIPHTKGIDEQWSREPQIKLPEYLMRLGFADRKFRWDVRVKHHTGTKPNGGMDGLECGDVSVSRSFIWRIPDDQRKFPPGDFNQDCVVNDKDVDWVLNHWGEDSNDKVLLILNHWGETCS